MQGRLMTRQMPKDVTTSQLIAYLRTLAATGNATLAAAAAGGSREWAYKKRTADARFDGRCREMLARFREGPAPPLPKPLSLEGRGAKRARVNRDRAGGWTRDKEERLLAALA